MSRILIIYATAYGQTHRIADAIAGRLRYRGHEVELGDASKGISRLPSPDDFDAVVLGSSVQLGRHSRAMGEYVRAHRAVLLGLPTAFFSVSMSASDPRAGTDPNGYVRKFLDEEAWEPRHWVAFGGALPYRQYGFLLRLVMKGISRAAGHTTDTSRDHEFTDWDEVERFADELAGDFPVVEPAPPPVAHARA